MSSILHVHLENTLGEDEDKLNSLHRRLLDAGVKSMVLALEGSALAKALQEQEVPHLYQTPKSFQPYLINALVQMSERLEPHLIHACGSRALGVIFWAKLFMKSSHRVIFQRSIEEPLAYFKSELEQPECA